MDIEPNTDFQKVVKITGEWDILSPVFLLAEIMFRIILVIKYTKLLYK